MRTKLSIFFVAVFFISLCGVRAQVTIGSELLPALGSLLDMKEHASDANNANSSKGLLLPRVLLSDATDLMPILPGASAEDKLAHVGLLVYHLGNQNMCSGVYSWSGTQWERLPNECKITTHCESVAVNGIYSVGQALNSTNTITLSIEVPSEAAGGTYTISTDIQNGISFSGTGTLVSGTQMITLAGSGTPSTGGVDIEFVLSAYYSNSISSTALCSPRIAAEVIPIGRTKIFGFGGETGTYGYHLESSASRAMLIDPRNRNFGPTQDYTVISDGFDIRTATLGNLTPANFINSSTSGLGLNPDILIMGYYSTTSSADVITALVDYLEKGGVFIMGDETVANTSISLQLLRRLFPASTINQKVIGNASGCVYGISSNIDDEITNGPFGDVRNMYWGADASHINGISGIPTDSIIVYSNADILGGGIAASSSPQLNPGYVSIFKHKRLNLFFIGDGGLNSNANTYIGPDYASTGACPFSVDANFAPIPRTGWGSYSPPGGGRFTVHNSQLFANIIAWAIKNARSNNRE